MENQLLHTPEGVRDIYNKECEQKMNLERDLMANMRGFGYRPIQTPGFEFFDIFSKEIGTIPSRDLYKFFDREGNTLVLRPDFTPSVARCAAKYFMEDEMQIRLCYQGNTFINNNSYQGRLKERSQCGAEFIGDASVEADAEILALVVDMLKTSGLQEFQVSVGHVDFLNGLFEYSHLGKEKENRVKELLLNRNYYGVEDIVKEAGLNENLIALYKLLNDVMMDRDKLENALNYAQSYPTVYNAVQRLIALEDILRVYQVDKYVSYELALISSHDYYSGVIFAGYTYGSGEAIVAGGRYDHLLEFFGKKAPAIGFCVIVDQLMSALVHQNLIPAYENRTICLVYAKERQTDAIAKAKELRANGEIVEMMLLSDSRTKEMYEIYCADNGIETMICMEA